MNIKEQFRKILNEFTVDKDDNPIWDPQSSIGGVAQKHGYSVVEKQKRYTRYDHPKGYSIYHNHAPREKEDWQHVINERHPDYDPKLDEFEEGGTYGESPEELDDHLKKQHK